MSQEADSNIKQFSFSNSVSSGLNYTIKNIYMTLSAYHSYVGALPIFYKNSNNDITESKVGSYNLLDILIKKSFFSAKLNLGIGIKNLFNTKKIESYSSSSVHSSSNSQSVAYGRTFFTSLNLEL